MKFTSFLLYTILSIVLVTVVHSKSTQNNHQNNDGSSDYEPKLIANQGNRRMIGEFYHPTMKQKYRNHLKKRAQQNSFGDNRSKPKSCGIMYRNKEPIGILQPFEESYKLIPVKHQKIDLELNEVPLNSDNFGSVFPRKTEDINMEDLDEETNLSQDSKVDENLDPSSFMMMNVPKRKRNVVSKDRRSVEDQLKDILDDMGLIDDDLTVKKQEKRMVKEDENLEEGVNNISMVKEKDDSRKDSKRSESAPFPVESQMMNDDDVVPLKSVQMRDERDVKRKRHLKSNEGKINAERKLNFLLDSVRLKARTATPIVGNRLKENHRNKRDDEQNSSAINEYEERVQRHIQSKIQALKEEVKREIESLQEDSTSVNEFIRKKRESEQQKKPNTLLDVETRDVNPVLNVDQELKPYIRRRRQLFGNSPITLVKYDVLSASNDSNVSVVSVAPAPSVVTPIVLPPSNNTPPINNSAPSIPNQSGEGVPYSKSFKCNANNTEINISFANGLQNIHISMNVTPSPSANNKRQITESNIIPTIITEPTTTIAIESKSIPKTIFDKLNFNIDDPLLNQNEIDQIIAPSMKNEIVLNDGLPNYNYKRSCDSGNCGVNNAGETCNCNTAGCSCGNIRKTRYADDYDDAENGKREIKEAVFEIDEDNDGLLEEDNNYENEENYPSQKGTIRRVVRNGEKSEYYIDMNPDIYHVASYDGDEDYMNRRKRFDVDDDMVALHGGTATRNHLNGIKSRSNSHSRVRRRIDREPNEDPIQLIDLSDEDIFGALPQSFEGELGRYKRVKR